MTAVPLSKELWLIALRLAHMNIQTGSYQYKVVSMIGEADVTRVLRLSGNHYAGARKLQAASHLGILLA
jgi:hypothetical protein